MTNNNLSQHTLSVHVNNKPGVLMRICQVFSRRGYNIESLVVSHGRHNNLSRMTIGVIGEEEKLNQIIQQINKLIDVIHCIQHDEKSSLSQEFALIKISSTSQTFVEISNAISHIGGKVIDKEQNHIIASIVGKSDDIDWALEVLSKFTIDEAIRTGKIVMARNNTPT